MCAKDWVNLRRWKACGRKGASEVMLSEGETMIRTKDLVAVLLMGVMVAGVVGCQQAPPPAPASTTVVVEHKGDGHDHDRDRQPPPPPPQDRRDPHDQDHRNPPPPPRQME